MFSDEDSDGTYGQKPRNGKNKSSRRDDYDEYSEDDDFTRHKRDSRERRGDSAKAKERRGGESRSTRADQPRVEDLNMARLSRMDLAEYKHRNFFEAMLKGTSCISSFEPRKLIFVRYGRRIREMPCWA